MKILDVTQRGEKLPESLMKVMAIFFFNLLLVTPVVLTTVEFLWNKYPCTSMGDVMDLLQKYLNAFCALHWQS